METIAVLFLGLGVGFLSCFALRSSGRRSHGCVMAGLGITLGGILVSLTTGEEELSWYMDALASGVLLCWTTILGGRGEIKRLVSKIKIALR
jgi:hypothetical protein